MENQNLNQQPVEQPIPQVPIQPEQPVISPQQPKTNWPILIFILVLAVVSYAGVAYWQGVWPFEVDKEVVIESPTPTPVQSIILEKEDYRIFFEVFNEGYKGNVTLSGTYHQDISGSFCFNSEISMEGAGFCFSNKQERCLELLMIKKIVQSAGVQLL